MRIRDQLEKANAAQFSAYCIIAAFGTYFCMYAFRKPFTAATFEGAIWHGIGFKTILVAAQVSGYTISKFIGIKVISEMPARYRALTILILIAIAEFALLMFALTPVPWNFVWLFINGLPLGMVFGLVLGFLEGRKVTEALSAGLCASFIVSSGTVKSVGHSLIHDYQVNEYWMPFVTGLIFVVPLLIFVWLLSQIPPPSTADEELRTRRKPMYRHDRRAFFRRHAVGLTGLIAIYILLTIVRSIRDDFAVEIWRDMGVSDKPEVFATSEAWVAIGVVLINGSIILIKNNRTAFPVNDGVAWCGFCNRSICNRGFSLRSAVTDVVYDHSGTWHVYTLRCVPHVNIRANAGRIQGSGDDRLFDVLGRCNRISGLRGNHGFEKLCSHGGGFFATTDMGVDRSIRDIHSNHNFADVLLSSTIAESDGCSCR